MCGSRQLATALALAMAGSFVSGPLMASANEPPTGPTIEPTTEQKTSNGRPPLSGEVSHTAHGHHVLGGAAAIVERRKWDKGPLLLSPQQDSIVETPYGEVAVSAGSVVLLVCSEQELAVYNLHDKRKGDVVINHDKEKIEITPERVAILAKSKVSSFEEANPAPFVRYRRVVCRDQGDDMKLYQADFEFMSMAGNLPPLRKLMESKDQGTNKTMGGMLKTAAVMMQISQSNEPYGYYITQRVRDISAAAKP